LFGAKALDRAFASDGFAPSWVFSTHSCLAKVRVAVTLLDRSVSFAGLFMA
jgi:hypothetical protein